MSTQTLTRDQAHPQSPIDYVVQTAGLSGGVISVADEGPGVPEADREKVFDRFWRGEDSRGMPGSGLGMAIVADVAASHGATAQIQEAPAGGALVLISLPGHPPSEIFDPPG